MARRNVIFYWPNVIGYVRGTLLIAGYVLTFQWPYEALACFLANLLLDNLDGWAARYFNQVRYTNT